MNTSPLLVSRRASLRLLGAAVCAGAAGCQRDFNPGVRRFAVSFQTLNNPFFVELNDAIKAAVEARGGQLVTLDARHDSNKQRNDLSDAIQQRPAAIFLNPVNWEGVRGSLVEAKRAGVPVIVIDTPVGDVDLVLAQVASDNVDAGRLAARALGKVKPAAQVAIVHHSVAKACIDRVAGFREVASEKFTDMTILQTEEGKGTTEGARPVMVDLLGRFPKLDAVFAINDPSAIGCASAIEGTPGRAGKVAIVTVDGSKEGIAAVKDGRLLSTSAQSPAEIGRVAVGLAFDHLDGKAVAKDVKIPVKLINREQADGP